jgi:hypothetical protein
MKNNLKFVIFLLLQVVFCNAQEKVTIANKSCTVNTVNASDFNIYDTWRIINHEFFIEMEHTYQVVLLNDSMEDDVLKMYKERKKHSEVSIGKYVRISKQAFEPFCANMHAIVLNPDINKSIRKFETSEYDIFPHLNGKKLLTVELLCPKDTSTRVYITVLNMNLIMIGHNSMYTFLERVPKPISKNLWATDEYGFNFVKVRGNGDFDFLLDTTQASNSKRLCFLIEKKKRGEDNFLFIKNFIKNNSICTFKWRTNYVVASKDSLKNFISFPLSLFKNSSNLFWVSGTTENPNEEWIVRWKVTEKIKKVVSPKVLLHSQIDQPTKMYLLKGDEVEIIEEKDEWLKIRYYGKKTIEGWIRRSDVE